MVSAQVKLQNQQQEKAQSTAPAGRSPALRSAPKGVQHHGVFSARQLMPRQGLYGGHHYPGGADHIQGQDVFSFITDASGI